MLLDSLKRSFSDSFAGGGKTSQNTQAQETAKNIIPLRLATALVILSLMLSSCAPFSPTTSQITSETQPKVTEVIPMEPSFEIPTPTITPTLGPESLENIINQTNAVNPVERAQSLYQEGNLKPAVDISAGSTEWDSIVSQGGDIDGTIQALQERLVKAGYDIKKMTFQAVYDPGGGWAIEVRDKDDRLYWAGQKDEGGETVLYKHPNGITDESTLFPLDPQEYGLEGDERVEIAISAGTAMGIVVANDGSVRGVLNPLTKEIIREGFTPIPTPAPTPTPTEVPPPYEVVEAYREEIRKEVLGVPVSIDIVTDVSLQQRDPKKYPIEKIIFNPRFPNPAEAITEATMWGIYYAWKDDKPEERKDVSFEEYMRLVKEYIEGKRPLEDVQYEIWANDLQTAEFKTEPYMFDPSRPIKVVYIDEKATKNLSYVGPRQRIGNQRNSNGGLELWLSYPREKRFSYWATYLYVIALTRFTWPVGYQHARPLQLNGEEDFYQSEKYQPEIWKLLMRPTGGFNSYRGAIGILPNDFPQH